MRIGFVANLLTRNGVATICCPISPYKETRDACREMIGEFVEVYVHATVDEIAAHRDPKGLYKKALAGEITGSPVSVRTSRTRRPSIRRSGSTPCRRPPRNRWGSC